MSSLKVGNIRVDAEQVGVGPDVVLIHGLGVTKRFWIPFVRDFLSAQFRVTIYDLRGHGNSEMPPNGYTSEDMANDLVDLLDALHIETAHIVGHSFGGRVALHAAALHPERVRSVTVVDSRFSALQSIPKLKEWSQWPAWKAGFERLGIQLDGNQEMTYDLLFSSVRTISPDADRALPGWMRLIIRWRRSGGAAEQWEKLLLNTTAQQDLDAIAGLTRDKIAAIRVPTLAIYGESSFCLPSLRELERLVKPCTPVVVPGAGHLVPWRSPRFFRSELTRFLAQHM
jgi:pimeloyl-ACP methyl ester carboxylesterase